MMPSMIWMAHCDPGSRNSSIDSRINSSELSRVVINNRTQVMIARVRIAMPGRKNSSGFAQSQERRRCRGVGLNPMRCGQEFPALSYEVVADVRFAPGDAGITIIPAVRFLREAKCLFGDLDFSEVGMRREGRHFLAVKITAVGIHKRVCTDWILAQDISKANQRFDHLAPGRLADFSQALNTNTYRIGLA